MTSQLPRLDLARKRKQAGWRRETGAGAGAAGGGFDECVKAVVGCTFLGTMPSIIPVGLVVSVMARARLEIGHTDALSSLLFSRNKIF